MAVTKAKKISQVKALAVELKDVSNGFIAEYGKLSKKDLSGMEDGARVDEAALRSAGLANGRGEGVKILGDGEVTRKLSVSAHAFSASARAKIEAKGGTCELLGIKKPAAPKP